jgi:hypothetical protein
MGKQRHLRYSSETPTFYHNDLAKAHRRLIQFHLSFSNVSAMLTILSPFTASIEEREGAILLFCPGHHTRLIKVA